MEATHCPDCARRANKDSKSFDGGRTYRLNVEAAGAIAYLLKPLQDTSLLAAIEAATKIGKG